MGGHSFQRMVKPLARFSRGLAASALAIRESWLGRRRAPGRLMTWGTRLSRVVRLPVIALGGVLLGTLMMSPAKDLVISITVILAYLGVTLSDPLDGLLLWVIAYPFTESSMSIPLGGGIPDLSPTRFCIAFSIIMLLAQTAMGRRRLSKVTKSDVVVVLFFIGVALSIGTSGDALGSFQVIFDRFLISIAGYFLFKNLVLTRRDLDRVLGTFLIIGAYAGAYAIYEQLTGHILFPVGEATRTQYTENIRILRGLFGGPHVFGSILALAIPIGFYRFLEASTSWKRKSYAALLGLLLLAMFLTYKRGAWISMIVSFLIMQFFLPRFRRIFWALMIVLSLVLVVTWDEVSQSEAYTGRVIEGWETGHGRTERFPVALELFGEKPIFGHGFAAFEVVSGFDAAENFYLDTLISAGLVGLVPLLVFWILIVKDSILIYRQTPHDPKLFVDRKQVVVFWAGLSTFLVKSLSGNQSVAIVHYLVFMLIGAMIGSQGELIGRKGSDASASSSPFLDRRVSQEAK